MTSPSGSRMRGRVLFKKGAAERVIIAAMPKLRAAMHLYCQSLPTPPIRIWHWWHPRLHVGL
ncbi:MAG TPA: hypothetical protein PK959_02610 [Candidatus Competibacteraceae bacterium]|nr:hypothetical protein [Candidatus Competibacteraceae bacterium]